MLIEIAGLPVSVSGGNESVMDALENMYRPFVVSCGPEAPIDVGLSHDDETEPASGMTVERHNGVYRIRSEDFDSTVDLEGKTARLRCRPNERVVAIFLRMLYSVLLPPRQGFLIHSVGIERKGRGYLFPGHSSSGKTTLAKHAEGFRVLNDEIVAVRNMSDSFSLFATPFGGEIETGPTSAGLEKICFLRPSAEGIAREVGDPNTVADLLEHILFLSDDTDSAHRLFRMCCMISSTVPAYDVSVFTDGAREVIDGI